MGPKLKCYNCTWNVSWLSNKTSDLSQNWQIGFISAALLTGLEEYRKSKTLNLPQGREVQMHKWHAPNILIMHTKTFCTWSASILHRTKTKFFQHLQKRNNKLNYVWTNGANWYAFSCVGSNGTQIHVNRARKHYDRNFTFYIIHMLVWSFQACLAYSLTIRSKQNESLKCTN